MNSILVSFSIIGTGLGAGYLIQHLFKVHAFSSEIDISRVRRFLQKTALLGLNPVATIGAIWIYQFDDLRVLLIPFAGSLTIIIGGLSGLLIGRSLKLPRYQMGAFFSVSCMFNTGSIGALMVFLLLGERGFALVPVFRLFEDVSYYVFAFPIARTFSAQASPRTDEPRIIRAINDPFVIVALSSIAVGLFLNISGVPRPQIYTTLNRVIIPLASLLLLVSIGMAMNFRSFRRYLPVSSLVATIKFMIAPAIVVSIAWVLGFGKIDGGLPLGVILILSSTPVAFTALVPPSIYDLDLDLANSAWLLTTLLLVLVVPLQVLLMRFL